MIKEKNKSYIIGKNTKIKEKNKKKKIKSNNKNKKIKKNKDIFFKINKCEDNNGLNEIELKKNLYIHINNTKNKINNFNKENIQLKTKIKFLNKDINKLEEKLKENEKYKIHSIDGIMIPKNKNNVYSLKRKFENLKNNYEDKKIDFHNIKLFLKKNIWEKEKEENELYIKILENKKLNWMKNNPENISKDDKLKKQKLENLKQKLIKFSNIIIKRKKFIKRLEIKLKKILKEPKNKIIDKKKLIKNKKKNINELKNLNLIYNKKIEEDKNIRLEVKNKLNLTEDAIEELKTKKIIFIKELNNYLFMILDLLFFCKNNNLNIDSFRNLLMTKIKNKEVDDLLVNKNILYYPNIVNTIYYIRQNTNLYLKVLGYHFLNFDLNIINESINFNLSLYEFIQLYGDKNYRNYLYQIYLNKKFEKLYYAKSREINDNLIKTNKNKINLLKLKNENIIEEATVKIQNIYKNIKEKKKIRTQKTMEFENEKKAAFKIQSIYRNIAEKKRIRIQKTIEFENENKAAIKIQNRIRNIHEKKRLRIQKTMELENKNKAAIKIQNRIRNISEKKRIRIQKTMELESENKAAIKIQNFLKRKSQKTNELKDLNNNDSLFNNDNLSNKSKNKSNILDIKKEYVENYNEYNDTSKYYLLDKEKTLDSNLINDFSNINFNQKLNSFIDNNIKSISEKSLKDIIIEEEVKNNFEEEIKYNFKKLDNYEKTWKQNNNNQKIDHSIFNNEEINTTKNDISFVSKKTDEELIGNFNINIIVLSNENFDNFSIKINNFIFKKLYINIEDFNFNEKNENLINFNFGDKYFGQFNMKYIFKNFSIIEEKKIALSDSNNKNYLEILLKINWNINLKLRYL